MDPLSVATGDTAPPVEADSQIVERNLLPPPAVRGFLADLIRCLPFKMKIGLMTVSRYRGATTRGGETRLLHDLNVEIRDRHVLVVDDILDTGTTLRTVLGELRRRGPSSIRVCVLLRKTSKAPKDLVADFVGFDIEDVFVVGYGLDYDDHYRNWPDIGVLRPELYA